MIGQYVTYQEHFSKFEAATFWQRFVNFPLVRIPIAVAFLIPAFLLQRIIFIYGREYLSDSIFIWVALIWILISIYFLFTCYKYYTKLIEKRSAKEISITQSLPEFGLGIFVGTVPIIIIVGIMYLFNSYEIESFGKIDTFVNLARLFAWAALLEEFLFRLILFRLLEEWLGSLWAIIVTALLFAAGHLFNPETTTWTTICIAILSLPETAAFMATRRIWVSWGSHFGWNYFMTAVFGIAVSGVSSLSTYIIPSIKGPFWLTGGSYGIEASVPGIVLPMVVIGFFIILAIRRNQIVKPSWKRKIKMNSK